MTSNGYTYTVYFKTVLIPCTTFTQTNLLIPINCTEQLYAVLECLCVHQCINKSLFFCKPTN